MAQNMFEAFHKNQAINVIMVLGRTLNALSYFKGKSEISTNWKHLPEADIYIIAVTDDAIKEVSDKINVSGLVVHTSGSVALSTLSKHKKRGVFYPLQTFTSGKLIDFNEVPLCLESHRKKDLEILNTLGGKVSSNVQVVDSEKRKVLHVAAVFVNNFTNYMYSIGNDICSANNLDFSMLYPLIKETAKKVEYLSPNRAQTGPAKRNDLITLHKHLQFLKDKKQRAIYKLLSNAIKASYEKEL